MIWFWLVQKTMRSNLKFNFKVSANFSIHNITMFNIWLSTRFILKKKHREYLRFSLIKEGIHLKVSYPSFCTRLKLKKSTIQGSHNVCLQTSLNKIFIYILKHNKCELPSL